MVQQDFSSYDNQTYKYQMTHFIETRNEMETETNFEICNHKVASENWLEE